MAPRTELMLVAYDNGECRVVEARQDEGQEDHVACASHFLPHDERDAPLLDYDLACNMTTAEMREVENLDGCRIVRREQFQ